jgi:Tfp pilus assembly protein PilF
MEDRQLQVLELVQRALAIDPDHARAHAALAFSLLAARRLPGAGLEIRIALSLDGGDNYIHYVAGAVMMAERKLEDAWSHVLVALEADSADAEAHVLGATIQVLRGQTAKARELLQEALAHHGSHCGALTELARLELAEGNRGAAAEHIALALQADSVDHDAHIVAGYIDLAAGNDAAAEEHARFVLNQDATDEAGLRLFTAVKAKRSVLLGAWWRWNSWISMRDDRRQIGLLIGTFVLMRILIIVTDELGYEMISHALGFGWLGFCAYTWFAPEMFRSWLKQELGSVRLDPEF